MVTTLPSWPGADHDRRHAGDVHLVGMQHGQRDAGAAAGVDRIAARLEDREAGGGGEVVAGRDGVPAAVEGRALGLGAELARGPAPPNTMLPAAPTRPPHQARAAAATAVSLTGSNRWIRPGSMPNRSGSPRVWCDVPSKRTVNARSAVHRTPTNVSRPSASIDSTSPWNGPASPASALHGRTCSGRTPATTVSGRPSGPSSGIRTSPWTSHFLLLAAPVELPEGHRRTADEPGDEDVGGVVVDRVRVANLLQHAAAHDGDPVAHRHRLDLVVGDARLGGDRGLALERLDLGPHLDAELGVEVREPPSSSARISAQRKSARGSPVVTQASTASSYRAANWSTSTPALGFVGKSIDERDVPFAKGEEFFDRPRAVMALPRRAAPGLRHATLHAEQPASPYRRPAQTQAHI